MPHYFFIWTAEIIEHLAEHDVSPDEFEEIVSHPDYQDVSRSTGNPLAIGTTEGGPCFAACIGAWMRTRSNPLRLTI